MNLDPATIDKEDKNDKRTTTLNATDRTKLILETVDNEEEVDKRNDRLMPYDI